MYVFPSCSPKAGRMGVTGGCVHYSVLSIGDVLVYRVHDAFLMYSWRNLVYVPFFFCLFRSEKLVWRHLDQQLLLYCYCCLLYVTAFCLPGSGFWLFYDVFFPYSAVVFFCLINRVFFVYQNLLPSDLLVYGRRKYFCQQVFVQRLFSARTDPFGADKPIGDSLCSNFVPSDFLISGFFYSSGLG